MRATQLAFDVSALTNEDSKTSLPVRVKPTFDEALRKDFAMSAKTSIFRAGASAPVKVLLEKNLLSKGSSLNFGKGKYDHDTNSIAEITGHCAGYDYTYMPDINVLGKSYTNIFSGYVVNTLKKAPRKYVWQQMASCSVDGVVFVAARTDTKNINGTDFEDGKITSIGTFQRSYAEKGSLVKEAKDYFEHVVEIKGKSGFVLIAASHVKLPENVLANAK